MANKSGRTMLVKKGATTLASVRSKSVTWNGTPVDVTTDDDAGATTYLADEFASTSLEMSVEGLTDDDVLHDIAFGVGNSAKHLSDITLVTSSGDTISGTFILTNYAETGAYEDAITFTATLIRSGIHTVTAP